MALPAGRYGVTFEQLRKIRKLPVNTIEMISDTQGGTARVENGTKPETAINAGEQFWHGSVLYTATSNISTSDTIVTSGAGANCEPSDPITEQLADKLNTYASDPDQWDTTPIAASTKPLTSGGSHTALQSKCDNSVIAPVEDGTNASQAYALGSHFIRGGKFCTVTTAMAQGDAIAGKYAEGDVASACADISSGSATDAHANITLDTSGYNAVYRQNNVVQFKVRFTVNTAFSTSADYNLFKLPFMPLIKYTYYLVKNRNFPYEVVTGAYINHDNGTVHIHDTLATGTYDIDGMFICK